MPLPTLPRERRRYDGSRSIRWSGSDDDGGGSDQKKRESAIDPSLVRRRSRAASAAVSRAISSRHAERWDHFIA